MKSFKISGAFLGWTLVFIFQWIFSVPLDYVIAGSFPRWTQFLGAGLVLIGILIISYEHEANKVDGKDSNTGEDKIAEYDSLHVDHSHPARPRGDLTPAKANVSAGVYEDN